MLLTGIRHDELQVLRVLCDDVRVHSSLIPACYLHLHFPRDNLVIIIQNNSTVVA